VRIGLVPGSADDARRLVRDTAARAAGRVLTGFSLADLLACAGGDHLALADLSAALSADGLAAVAAAPVDRLGEADSAAEAVRAVRQGGLGVWRATVDRAPFAARLDLIERAEAIHRETHAFKAFAPLPEFDPADQPSTGYDDVRTVALARLVTTIPAIQVSWPLYGPKLAQVAIAYGAGDIDGVAAVDVLQLGHRRSPREEIERQIRAAFARPAERDGRFEPRS
jgi:aminodeoxyfutalosine synthase